MSILWASAWVCFAVRGTRNISLLARIKCRLVISLITDPIYLTEEADPLETSQADKSFPRLVLREGP